MRGYVLTERGKFLIAIIIVLLLIIPSIIFIVRASMLANAPDDLSQMPNPDLVQFLPPGNDEEPASPDSSLSGPIALDVDNGLLTFLFMPGVQTSLDENTISMIGELLTSPLNTSEAKIAVEIPQLPDNDAAVLTAAIINAFDIYLVPISKITFFVYILSSDIDVCEINISFR